MDCVDVFGMAHLPRPPARFLLVLGVVLPVALCRAELVLGRVDVSPSGGGTNESPSAVVAGECRGLSVYAGSGNRGDWDVAVGVTADAPKGRALLLSKGILIPSLNEHAAAAHRGVIGVGGKLTSGHGSGFNGGPWVAGFTAAGGGSEANYDFAFGYFAFEEGWLGAHVAKDGTTVLGSGNLPKGTVIRCLAGGTFDGEILVTVPGVDSRDDGLLFTTAAGNGDDTTAAGPLPDGSGWHVRVADEGHNYKSEQAIPFSLVYIPYDLAGITAGRVGTDGTVLRGVGGFVVNRVAAGRYELIIPGSTGDDGVLLLTVTKMNKDGVEDNALAWVYDEVAAGGRGAFVVESYDQPSFGLQDCEFGFAFLAYEEGVSPSRRRGRRFTVAETWEDSLLRGAAAGERVAADPVPWVSGDLRAATSAERVSVPVGAGSASPLWLVADALGHNGNDHTVWAEARFVLENGTHVPLSSSRPLAVHVGYGAFEVREVVVDGRPRGGALYAHAPSALAYDVPDGAVRFEAWVGLADSASAEGLARCSVTTSPYHRGRWSEEVWPVLRRVFPVETAQLHRDLPDIGRRSRLVLDDCVSDLEAGSARLASELGGLMTDARPRSEGGPRDLLRYYGAAARMRRKLVEARGAFWAAAPGAAHTMDYPGTGFTRLRSVLEEVKRARPALAGRAGVQAMTLARCGTAADAALRAIIAGGRPDPDSLARLTRDAQDVAAWVDRVHGWTTFGGDNQRSWVSREPVTLPLSPAWIYRPAHGPSPAWPPPRRDNPAVNHQLHPTLTYDRAFHPVVSRDLVVFGSSSEDVVFCLRGDDGEEVWRHPTDGPVRLAPTISAGRVYVGTDGGSLLCLDLTTGRRLWRYRPGGDGGRLLSGNGRLISSWAVRCGICVAGDTLYAGAGIFPGEGTVLFALDTATGHERWRTPVKRGPQGFMLMTPTRLFVPTGRTPFLAFERATGTPITALGRSNSWGSDLPGGTMAVVVNDRILTGPDEGGEFHMYGTESAECVVRTRGRRILVDGRVSYVLRADKVVAQSRDPFVERGKVEVLWQVPVSEAYCMLKAGDHLLLGGDGDVMVIDAETGSEAARIPVGEGRVEGLVWQGGRLLVSMGDGAVVCLRSGAGGRADVRLGKARPPVARTAGAADRLAAALNLIGGYAFVQEDLGLARGLADACPELKVVLGLSSLDAVDRTRLALSRAARHGADVVVVPIVDGVLPFRPFLFDAVVLGDSLGSVSAAEWGRVVRPEGGVLVLGKGTARPALPGRIVGEWTDVAGVTGFGSCFRRGPIPGGGTWTHAYADAGNSACSHDRMRQGDFGVLWFGRPGPRHMLNRHIKGAAPVYADGVGFVTGADYLAAVDAYNGTVLWERHVAGSGRVGMLKDCGNMVAADGCLFVAVDDACHVYGGRNGEHKETWPAGGASGETRHWGYIAAAGDLLVGSATRPGAELQAGDRDDYQTIWYHGKPVVTSLSLFARERSDGSERWRYVPEGGVLLNPTMTVLGGNVIAVESADPGHRDHPDGKIPLPSLLSGKPLLTALRCENGRPAWRVPLDLSGFEHALYMSGADGVLVLTGTRHEKIKGRTLVQYRVVGIAADSGRELWRCDNTPSYAHVVDGGHGEQTQHPALVNGRIYGPNFVLDLRSGSAIDMWKWQKSNKCATLSTSTHCAFSRQNGNPTVAAFADGKARALTTVTRPGCWINTLPVGGIVLIPEASSGCSCGYAVQTSLALYPLEEP